MLEPMNPADRKVIHDAIGEIDGVRSFSEGEEPNRSVVIASERPPVPAADDDAENGEPEPTDADAETAQEDEAGPPLEDVDTEPDV